MAQTSSETSGTMITFKFLRDLQKAERDSAELQLLPKEFFALVDEYLARKTAIVRRDPTNNEAQKRELEAMKPVIRYIFDRREQKIVSGAVKAARTEFKLQNMLREEEELFDRLVVVLRNARTKFEATMEGIETGGRSAGANTNPTSEKPLEKRSERNENLARVKFTTAAPEFIAEDGKSYGPFVAGQEAELPKMAADVLVKAKKAVLT